MPDAVPTRTEKLSFGSTAFEAEIQSVTEGAPGADIGALLRTSGLVTYDPGFANTAVCRSTITYIDGDAGILRHRGYPIEELAAQSSFVEVAYLLIHGELPTPRELGLFGSRVRARSELAEPLQRFFKSFPKDAHPMSVLASAVSALSAFYPDSLDPLDPEQVEVSTERLLAQVPVLAACAFKQSLQQPFLLPDPSLGLVEDFCRMSLTSSAAPEVDDQIVRALDLLFVLHADHEQNCSTSTVRFVGSAHASLHASISAGIGALSGPLHGGANQAVLEMLTQIRDSDDDVASFVRRVKQRENHARLMGFGHRVYKNYDPRAAIIKKTADELLSALGKRDELLDIALKLESVALSDDYFVDRKLYPNVDFYTGLLYRAMGFPPEMFTVLFAIGRLPGWVAQWREMITDPETRIGRPRQLYVGSAQRPYPVRG